MMRGFALAGLVGGIALAPACSGKPEVSFAVSVPSDLASQVAWYEIAAFRGTSCGALEPQLSGGVPIEGASARLSWRAKDNNPPALGDLTKDRYAFVAVARREDCAVIATGCTGADVSDDDSVTIVLQGVQGCEAEKPCPGTCAAGAV